jgi:hypothetical protein
VRRAKRQNAIVLAVATIVGVWLGVAAPAVSPVAAPPIPVPVTIPAPASASTAPTATTTVARR